MCFLCAYILDTLPCCLGIAACKCLFTCLWSVLVCELIVGLVYVSNSSPLACSRLASPHCWGRQVTLEVQRWYLGTVSQEKIPRMPILAWVPSPEAACAQISLRQKESSVPGISIWLLLLLHFLSHELVVVQCVQEGQGEI